MALTRLKSPAAAARWLKSWVTGTLRTDSRAVQPDDAFIDLSVAMRASSKPNASTWSCSTRHVAAPASSALATKRRPSLA